MFVTYMSILFVFVKIFIQVLFNGNNFQVCNLAWSKHSNELVSEDTPLFRLSFL